jgi:putative transcriptional regulator
MEPDHAMQEPGTLAEMNNKLRVLRAERKWSQGELSQRLGVSRQAINAIETGKHDPSLDLAFKMAALFEMTIEQIFEPERNTAAQGEKQ